jgi:hypothetical protein
VTLSVAGGGDGDSDGTKYIFKFVSEQFDRLSGLVVRVRGYRSWVRDPFAALPDFPRSSGSGKGSTQPREYD